MPAPQDAGEATSAQGAQLVIITGLSGSGKGTVLKVFEDMGFYPVDNLPVDLIPTFAELCRTSAEISRAALVVDIREGEALTRFPRIYEELKALIPSQLIFLGATDGVLQRRFSETRRPHPVGGPSVQDSIKLERDLMRPIEELADVNIDSSRFNIHELRHEIKAMFDGAAAAPALRITIGSFGYKHGVPTDGDLIFDVRFLPNPHYEPGCRYLTGKDRVVADFVAKFPQTHEFIKRTTEMIAFLLPHYIEEGKSYLTIYFGCTGGRHRSVFIAETIAGHLVHDHSGVKLYHRDIEKEL